MSPFRSLSQGNDLSYHKYIKIILLNGGDIGMANYEKQVEQEAAYPIPIYIFVKLLQDSETLETLSGVAIAMPLFSCLTVL